LAELWKLLVCKQEIVDKLFPPFDYASDYMQREHSERVQDVYALLEQTGVAIGIVELLGSRLHLLDIFIIGFPEYFF